MERKEFKALPKFAREYLIMQGEIVTDEQSDFLEDDFPKFCFIDKVLREAEK